MNDKEMGENKTKDIIWRDYFQDISEIREIDDKKIEISGGSSGEAKIS